MTNNKNTVSAFLINQSGIHPVQLELRHDHGLSYIEKLIECSKGSLITERSPLFRRNLFFLSDQEVEYGFVIDGLIFHGNAIVVGTSEFLGDLVDVNIRYSQLKSLTVIDDVIDNIFGI